MDREQLGPAERIINTLLSHVDHLVHNRNGMVVENARAVGGADWSPISYKVENNEKVVYSLQKVGKKTQQTRIGVMQQDGRILDGRRVVGRFQQAGLSPQVVTWAYRQVADIWQLDNEFSARWASYAFAQEHRDFKVVLAAFMLVQSRKGDPVKEGDKIAFLDDDYRSVGEAMFLLTRKDGKDFNPKLLLRVYEILNLPQVAAINRELGFARSARHPYTGRWEKAVTKWLHYREENPRMLEGLVKAGWTKTVRALAVRSHFKPMTARFYEILRWKQEQCEQGHRTIAIGAEVGKAESWEGLTEKQICEKIVETKPNFKRIVGLVPKKVGLTRAIVAAAVESNALSAKDLIIATPTLEELGLLEVPTVKKKWEKAVKEAEDQRASNVAKNVKSKVTADKLQEASDNAAKKAVQETMRGLRLYAFIDVSSSMERAIGKAKEYVAKLLPAFTLDKMHVATFNTIGKEITIKHSSTAGVENAFKGIKASGGTQYGQGVIALQKYKPKDDEDALFFFVGDEEADTFAETVRLSGLKPVAFVFLKVGGDGSVGYSSRYNTYEAVRGTARELGIPCIMVDDRTFGDDPYAIPRMLRNLIASTPVAQRSTPRAAPVRESLIDIILKTDLLKKPAWAA